MNEITKYLAIGALGGSLLTGGICWITSHQQSSFTVSGLSQEEQDIRDLLKDFIEARETLDVKISRTFEPSKNIIWSSFFQTKELFEKYLNEIKNDKYACNSRDFEKGIVRLVHLRSLEKKLKGKWEAVWEYKDIQGGKEVTRGVKKSLFTTAFDPKLSYGYFQAHSDIEIGKSQNPQGLHVTSYVVEEVKP